MRILMLSTATIALLAGCSPANDSSGAPSEVTEQPATEMVEATGGSARSKAQEGSGAAPVKVSLPQLAYSYKLGFLVPGPKVVEAQEAHRALCEGMGPARCQLLALESGSGDDEKAEALMRLRVATAEASRFSKEAGRIVDEAGGRARATNVNASDVSKEIVDAEARIRQRELLVERLTQILRNRSGKVEELLEAERSVAQAQEELDQTKAWLSEIRGRVAMSDFEIRYTAIAASASPESAGGRIGEALADSGTGFLIGVRTLLVMAIYLGPWALLAFGGFVLVRRFRRKRDTTPAQP